VHVVRRSRRALPIVVVLASILAFVLSTTAVAAARPPRCIHRTLVLAAMPLELNPLLRATTLDPDATVEIDGRTFYVGKLAGNHVVLAMTGIGLVNAEQTATAAFEHFRCSFRAAVFSGVAGSRHNIGDVAIPRRWTMDGGRSWVGTDDRMFAIARSLRGRKVALSPDVPIGDAACLCPGVDAPLPVTLPEVPRVYVGGSGISSDTYGGHPLPCIPGGGDVFGCVPCLPGNTAEKALEFAANAPSYLDPAFFMDFFQPPEQTTGTYEAQDQETAAVARVARRYRVPFLGIRAASDGEGDPLMLPGFPAQFFVYRQLAGNNAAAVTIAFLATWKARGQPVSR